MSKWDSDALSAPHSKREIDMIEDGKVVIGNPISGDLITVPPIMHSFEDTTHAYECGYRDGYKAAKPTVEVERLSDELFCEGEMHMDHLSRAENEMLRDPVVNAMTPQDLLDLGSQLEAHATMVPGAPIPINPVRVAHMLMWAAREIENLQGRK